MKKKLMIMLGMIMVIACIGLTACGSSESEEQATEPETEATEAVQEETAAPTMFWGGYGYMGEDPAEGAVYEYAATKLVKGYDVEEGMVSIPVVCIVDRVDNEDGSVDVYGEFEIFNYTVEGDTLVCQSGGSHPGKMHLVKDGDQYKVEKFEPVGDGSEFDTTAKEIFGDKYDAFMKVYSDDKAKDAARTETIKNYVQATGLEVTQYQDYGWPAVKL